MGDISGGFGISHGVICESSAIIIIVAVTVSTIISVAVVVVVAVVVAVGCVVGCVSINIALNISHFVVACISLPLIPSLLLTPILILIAILDTSTAVSYSDGNIIVPHHFTAVIILMVKIMQLTVRIAHFVRVRINSGTCVFRLFQK